uniref:LIM zinc-binding domain-containing protein n=1 Tax=Macrostomum lignano TaxID=282301 RepID=A0A1I8I3N8_9PLAT
MDKKCTACGKTVYPLEQLKCLDQIWHKQCFKCEVCGMTLNMKNYKGLEKKPYCSAHYPQPKAYTFVSDNPEMQRVKQNTAVISNVKYHEEFEKSKGTRMAVTEDMMTPSAGAAARKPAPPPVAATAQSSNAAVVANRRGSTGASSASSSIGAAPGSIFAYDPMGREAEAASAAAAAATSSEAPNRAAFDPHAAKRGSTIYSSEDQQAQQNHSPVNSSYTGQSTVYTTSAIGRRQQPHQPAAPEPHQPPVADSHHQARYSRNSDYGGVSRNSGYGEPAAAEPG